MSNSVDVKHLIKLFDQTFFERFNTRLLGGADEPVYLPANYSGAGEPCTYQPCSYHRLYFRADYVSSAFHEIAHWCIAGAERRQQADFGYWYQPDGRGEGDQRRFEQAEIKPQALEWHLSTAAGHRFHLSADNLNGTAGHCQSFATAVCEQALAFCQSGLPSRARTFIEVLQAHYQTGNTLLPALYRPELLAEYA